MSGLLGGLRSVDPYHVLETIGIVFSGLLFYSYAYSWFPPGQRRNRLPRALLNGSAFGILTVAMMIARIEVEPGIFIDARLVPVALIALFEGWPAGLVAALTGSAYRLWLGGSGALPGVAGLLATAVAGGAVYAWARRRGRGRMRHSMALAGLTFLITLLAFSLLGRRGLALFARVWEHYLVMMAMGIGLAAKLFQDVAEQHRLTVAQQRFRTIIDEAHEAIRIWDAATYRIVDVNRADCELSGYSREDLLGRDVRDLWPEEPELRARREAAVAEGGTAGTARSMALPYRRRSGEMIAVDSSRRVVSIGGRRYHVVIARDARERLAAEAAQREAAELRAATLLARAAAHEINNPLSVIMGYLQILAERQPDGAATTKWVTPMLDAARRIRDSVERLKGLIRVEATPAGGDVPPILDTRKSSASVPGPSPSGSPLPPASPADPAPR